MEARIGNGQPLILSEETYQGVGEILDDLIANTRADAIIFCESNGYPIVHKGQVGGLDLSAFSTLAANNFSATAEMAAMLGEATSFRYLFHEGENKNVYLSDVGFDFLLVAIFRKEVALGLIRIYTRKAMKQLHELLNVTQRKEETNEFLDLEFKTLLNEEVNRSLNL